MKTEMKQRLANVCGLCVKCAHLLDCKILAELVSNRLESENQSSIISVESCKKFSMWTGQRLLTAGMILSAIDIPLFILLIIFSPFLSGAGFGLWGFFAIIFTLSSLIAIIIAIPIFVIHRSAKHIWIALAITLLNAFFVIAGGVMCFLTLLASGDGHGLR